jgi:hypothetical protein
MAWNLWFLKEDKSPQDDSRLEEMIMEFRQILPPTCATAQAIDQREPWEQIALKAIDDGYIEFADEFNAFVETCLRRGT